MNLQLRLGALALLASLASSAFICSDPVDNTSVADAPARIKAYTGVALPSSAKVWDFREQSALDQVVHVNFTLPSAEVPAVLQSFGFEASALRPEEHGRTFGLKDAGASKYRWMVSETRRTEHAGYLFVAVTEGLEPAQVYVSYNTM